ncbi:unnamed protein product [Trifolium pratense]|uniref:Uncharacterized protein n=1 Tax=Trifolium pratense TaxID=57577 RepID=A0ACB0LMX3_TRIPR|nr:unnamed protein product [Trifolium pratense]
MIIILEGFYLTQTVHNFFYYKMIQPFSIGYIQMRKNMAAIIKFVYAIILFISLLFVVTEAFQEDILNKNCTNVFEYQYPCVGAAHIVCIDGHCYCCGA